MPKNRLEGVVFGIILSCAMEIGMEGCNAAIKRGFSLQPGGL